MSIPIEPAQPKALYVKDGRRPLVTSFLVCESKVKRFFPYDQNFQSFSLFSSQRLFTTNLYLYVCKTDFVSFWGIYLGAN